MISFERLDSALQEMNVTLAEYEHFINNFSMDYKEEFLEDIILADIADDVDKLHNLYLEAMKYDSKMLAYCAKSRYEILTQTEADDVVEYLYDVGEWGYFELSIFYLTLDSFSEREIMYLMKELWGKSKHLYGVFNIAEEFFNLRIERSFCFPQKELVIQLEVSCKKVTLKMVSTTFMLKI